LRQIKLNIELHFTEKMSRKKDCRQIFFYFYCH